MYKVHIPTLSKSKSVQHRSPLALPPIPPVSAPILKSVPSSSISPAIAHGLNPPTIQPVPPSAPFIIHLRVSAASSSSSHASVSSCKHQFFKTPNHLYECYHCHTLFQPPQIAQRTRQHFNMFVLQPTVALDTSLPTDMHGNPLPLKPFVTMVDYTTDCISSNWKSVALLDIHSQLLNNHKLLQSISHSLSTLTTNVDSHLATLQTVPSSSLPALPLVPYKKLFSAILGGVHLLLLHLYLVCRFFLLQYYQRKKVHTLNFTLQKISLFTLINLYL